MIQSLLQRLPFLSGSTDETDIASQPLLVVEMSDTAIRYLSVKPSVEEGAPYSLHASGCLLASDYSTAGAWHTDAASQLRKYKLKKSKIIGLLAAQDYQLYQTTSVAAETHDDLVSAMRWKLKDLTAGEPTDYALDVVPMGDAGGRLNQQVLVVAAKNEVVATRLSQFKAIGLKVDALSAYEVSLAHLVTGLLPESSCLASLYVTDHEFIISASQANRLIMFRRIPKDAMTTGDQGVPMRIVGEVVRSLDRVSRQFPDVQLDALFVDAGPDTQAYLDTFKQELRIACEVLTPYAALVEEVAPLFFDQRLVPLAGAALSHTMGVANINLLGDDAVEQEVKLPFKQIAVGSAVVAVLSLGLGGYISWTESQTQAAHVAATATHQAEIEAINKQVQEKSAPVENLDGLQKVLQSYTAIQNYLASQSGAGEAPFSAWMETLARSIPDGLWLTKIEFSALSSGSLSLSGMAKSNESLTAWVDLLNKTVALDGKQKFDVLDIKQNPDNGYWLFVVKSQGAK